MFALHAQLSHGAIYPGPSLRLPSPLDGFISQSLCLPILWYSTFSISILKIVPWEIGFLRTYMSENIFILPSYLIYNLVDIRFWNRNNFFFRILIHF